MLRIILRRLFKDRHGLLLNSRNGVMTQQEVHKRISKLPKFIDDFLGSPCLNRASSRTALKIIVGSSRLVVAGCDGAIVMDPVTIVSNAPGSTMAIFDVRSVWSLVCA